MKDWKLTWGYVPITYDTELGKLEDMTQHVIIPNNLDGDKIKLKFSNIGNDCPLVMERVTFCTRNCFTGILTEGITVTKAGKSEINLGPNEEFWSDEIEVSVTHMDLLEIFTYFKESSVVKTACVTWCEDAWTSNLYKGDCRSGEQLSYKDILPYLGNDPYQNHALFGFSRIAVLTDSDVITLGVYGDSITHMSFYSGPLTQMLHRRKPGKISVVNGGIAGNRVTEDAPFADFLPGKGKQFGEAGTRRIERDMLLEYPPDIFFCMEGVNDCTHCFAFNEDKITTGEDIFAGIQSILSKAKTAGCRTIVSTIAPFGCYQESFREPAEAIRQSVNEKLRSSNFADEIIDLDKLLRKEDDIHFMKDELHFGDGVHPNIKGGRVIAKALLPIVLGEELDFREEEVKAVPYFENPTAYPIETLAEMVRLSFKEKDTDDLAEKNRLQRRFVELREGLAEISGATKPIILWPKGAMPSETEYIDNFDCVHLHNPDFIPTLIEVPIRAGTVPVGAIMTIAGGEHGMNTLNECYQICKDFNSWGFQGFIINGRPNRGPWSGKECGADVARAIRYVRANAKKYGIPENRIVLAGFSNGGIAIEQCIQYYSGNQMVADHFAGYKPDALDNISADIDAQICVYGARHLGTEFDYDKVNYPPTFYAIGRKDYVGVHNMNGVYKDLVDRGIPVEVHTFSGHPHGYAGWSIIDPERADKNFDLWERLALHFLEDLFR